MRFKPNMTSENLFESIPSNLPQELYTTLLAGSGVTIERIVSQGHSSPADFWYDQQQHEWVILLAGEAKLQFEDHTLHLKVGDYVNIRAHVKHRVAWTTPEQPTIWLALFY